MSDVTLLRKLSFKSYLKFGSNYQDLTVQQIIDTGFEGVKYLIWVYYSASKISFLPEVLTTLGIPESLQIEKPGKNPEKLKEIWIHKKQEFKNLDEEDKTRIISMNKKIKHANKKDNTVNLNKLNTVWNNKKMNQRKNHGH